MNPEQYELFEPYFKLIHTKYQEIFSFQELTDNLEKDEANKQKLGDEFIELFRECDFTKDNLLD